LISSHHISSSIREYSQSCADASFLPFEKNGSFLQENQKLFTEEEEYSTPSEFARSRGLSQREPDGKFCCEDMDTVK